MSNNSDDWKWLRDSLEKLDARLDEQGRTLVRNTATLEVHVKRTELLEEDIKPLRAHVSLMNNTAKLISVCAAAAVLAHQMGAF